MTRFHDLDALRGFAMLLGILLHAGRLSRTGRVLAGARGVGLGDRAGSQRLRLDPVGDSRFPDAAVLPAQRLLHRDAVAVARAASTCARHRLKTPRTPVAGSGMFTVVPAIEWLDAGADFTLFDWPLAWLGGLHHLWFLWYLLLLAATFIAAVRLGLTFRHPAWWLLVPLDRGAAVRNARGGFRSRHGGRPDSGRPRVRLLRHRSLRSACSSASGTLRRGAGGPSPSCPRCCCCCPPAWCSCTTRGSSTRARVGLGGGRGGAGRLRVADVLRIDGTVPLDLRA